MRDLGRRALVLALLLLPHGEMLGQTATVGRWGSVITWPHVAVHAAQLTNGRILTWAAATATDFNPAEPNNTVAAVFNPDNNSFQDMPNPRHNMFCAGLARLPDGRVIAAGGGFSVRLTSLFVPSSSTWIGTGNTIQQRWYGTNVALPNGKAFLALGAGDQPFPELWDPATNAWTEIYGPRMDAILAEWHTFNAEDFEWYPWLHVAPNGKLFHSGPTPRMHWVDPFEGGTITDLGPRFASDRMRMWGSSLMYAPGKILVTGGRDMNKSPSSTNAAFTIDINGPTPVVTSVSPMNYARVFHYTLNLPNGEVLALGGNTSSFKFSDQGAVLPAEIWNPNTGQWRTVASQAVPRPYHGTAALLDDGRVLSTGGGICGSCGVNHLNGQIYSPPYLFKSNGDLASRPSINSGSLPGQVRPGVAFTVRASSSVNAFRMIRLQATTHGIQTDSRSFSLPITNKNDSGSGSLFTLQPPASANIMVPGDYWLFAVNSSGVPSVGRVIRAVP
jgi:galactose oxidase